MSLYLKISFWLLVAALIVPKTRQEEGQLDAPAEPDETFEAAHEASLEFACDDAREMSRLGDDCRILKYYNQTEIDSMGSVEPIRLARHCACELAYMEAIWLKNFDSNPHTRRLCSMVEAKIRAENRNPPNASGDSYLWTDIDVALYRVSIYTVTKDYFDQLDRRAESTRLDPKLRRQIENNTTWRIINAVCRKVAQDHDSLYQYLENLARLNPLIFLQLVQMSQPIEIIYQASKACKLLLNQRLSEFKLKPDSLDFIPVANFTLSPAQTEAKAIAVFRQKNLYHNENDLDANSDLDSSLKNSPGFKLTRCMTSPQSKLSMIQLSRRCAIMFSDYLQPNWIEQFDTPTIRSEMTIECGCQLLLHNGTWAVLMKDPNVKTMADALTTHMNRNIIPDFADTPIWTLYGWFNDIISEFRADRKFTIKQIITIRNGDQDPLKPIRHDEYEQALEILRRGCNLIKFNYSKDSKTYSELKLVKYLDRLQLVSQDPMFIFHLTLQNPDLFKLYSLSKVCDPIVK